LKVNSNMILTENYDDHGGLQGPLQNGQTYYYQATAVYLVTDSIYIELGPSNNASATPQNHPPATPTSLVAMANGRDVNLSWHFVDDVGDLQYFGIERQTEPSSEWIQIDQTGDTTYSETIGPGLDAVYGYRIIAYDDGNPQLASPPSNPAYVLVGHLAPGNLSAQGSLESRVPLQWTFPGAWTDLRLDGSGSNDPIAAGLSRVDEISQNGDDGSNEVPIIADRGGPDSSGYCWIDSDEPDGPVYSWRDITDMGTQIPLNDDNQNLGPFPIGFDFTFYGTVFDSFYICTNGWISFTDGMHTFNINRTIPLRASAPFNMVAPFWDDLTFASGGQSWYYSDGNELVISYIDVPRYSSGGPYTFQIVLNKTGSIDFQYQTMNEPLNSATIGIQNGSGTIGLQVNYNSDYVHDDMAIRLWRPSEGFPPVHYNLYRSLTSPVPIDSDHLIAGDIPGIRKSFEDDSSIQNGTTYYYRLTAIWPDSVESPPSNETSAVPLEGARIAVTPAAFSIAGESGQVSYDTLNIANTGGLDLYWDIFAQSEPFRGMLRSGGSANVSPAVNYIAADMPGGSGDTNDPPRLCGRGGPDDFGYFWIDSDEPGGPVYNWADITGRGQQLSMGNDDNEGPFPIEFDFHYYDSTFSSYRVCSNGWISFTSSSLAAANSRLPSLSAPPNLIAPFWDDLDPSAGGEVWYYSNADSVVVSWIAVPHRTYGGHYTFQVVLTRSGAIIFNYASMTAPLNSATIGIQDMARTVGLQVAYNQAYIHDSLSTRLSTSWLSTQPVSGIIAGGNDSDIVVACNAAGLAEGVYHGSLIISGHDTNNVLNTVIVPVDFHVTQSGVEDNNSGLPNEFALLQNYPNPFNPTTEIRFNVPAPCHVSVEIYNVIGQKVRILADTDMEPGYKAVVWNGTDENNRPVSSGIYFYRLVAGDKVYTKKMTMLK
jgi:hypothetical protein